MPMAWNAENNEKLLAFIFGDEQMKFDCAKIAAQMGPDCTAKAISHRIAKYRNSGKTTTAKAAAEAGPSDAQASSATATPPKANPKAKAVAPKTPRKPSARKPSSKKRKATSSEDSDEAEINRQFTDQGVFELLSDFKAPEAAWTDKTD